MADHCTTSSTMEECCASLQESRKVSSHLSMAQRYGPGTWVIVESRDMGNSLMIGLGTHGGAPCPGVTHHPWTRKRNSLPITFVPVYLSRSSASSTISAAKPAIRGLTAISSMARPVWTSAHASQLPAQARCAMLWWPHDRNPVSSPRLGAKKLLVILTARYPQWPWPVRSTVRSICKRLLPSMNPHHAQCCLNCRPWTIPTAFMTGPGAQCPARLIGAVRHRASPKIPSPARAGRGRWAVPVTTGQLRLRTPHRGRSRR